MLFQGSAENFRSFLQQEFNEENLDFWLDVEKYKQQNPRKRRKSADKIFDTYLREEALKEVVFHQNFELNLRSVEELTIAAIEQFFNDKKFANLRRI